MSKPSVETQEDQTEKKTPRTEEEIRIQKAIDKARKQLEWSFYGCLPMVVPAIIIYLKFRKNQYFIQEAKQELKGKILRDCMRILILLSFITVILLLYFYDI